MKNYQPVMMCIDAEILMHILTSALDGHNACQAQDCEFRNMILKMGQEVINKYPSVIRPMKEEAHKYN